MVTTVLGNEREDQIDPVVCLVGRRQERVTNTGERNNYKCITNNGLADMNRLPIAQRTKSWTNFCGSKHIKLGQKSTECPPAQEPIR